MRSVFHQILARYLGSEQHAFGASARDLWPESWSESRWQAVARAAGAAEEPDGHPRIYREFEPQV